MERTKNLLIVLIILFRTISLDGQSRVTIYQAYTDNNMDKWKAVIDSLEDIDEKSDALRLELLNYQYGYIGWCIGTKNKEAAKHYYDLAQNNLETLENEQFNLAEIYAYKSAFVGFEIGLSPYKAPFIGLQSIEFANKAIAADSDQYLGYVQLGNIEFYRPAIFGGSKTKAIEYYQKALKKMEANPALLTENWNYLSLLATLINAYIEIDNFSKARDYCIKTLKIAPDFHWVKNELYPLTLKNE